MPDTFDHDYKSIIGVLDIQGIDGYCKGLLAVVQYLEEVTKGNPDNRYIDAVPLLEKISATSKELENLQMEYKADINDLFNLQN